MRAHAHVLALPPLRGDGRLRQSVAVNWRMWSLYSSFKWASLKVSVSRVISSNRACISLGTFCDVVRLDMIFPSGVANYHSQDITVVQGVIPAWGGGSAGVWFVLVLSFR